MSVRQFFLGQLQIGSIALVFFSLTGAAQQPRPDKLNSALSGPAVENHSAMASELLSRGADVNYVNKFGMTALHYATSTAYGEAQMVELLLHAGADTKVRTKDGLTALALVKKYGNTYIQRVLEHAGASR